MYDERASKVREQRVGWLLGTKADVMDEGGVDVGFRVPDSVHLVD